MSIRVGHDIPGGQLAAGSFLAGLGDMIQKQADRSASIAQMAGQTGTQAAMQTERLAQQRDLAKMEIDARAQLQKRAAEEAYARTAVEHGLDQQIREQELQNNIVQMREQAKLQAQQWEFQYTAQQRQEIARFNNARQAIEQNQGFSPEEKSAALQLIDLQQSNIKPAMMPRDPGKPIYPEGRGVGELWSNEDGSTVTRTPDGQVKLIQRFDQSPKFHEAKLRIEQEKAQMELQAKQEQELAALKLKQQDAILQARLKIATTPVAETDKDGIKTTRLRTVQEVNEIMQSVLGDQQGSQPAQQQAQDQGLSGGQGEPMTPGKVAAMKSRLRYMNSQYGGPENAPPEVQAEFRALIKAVTPYIRR